MVAKRTQVFLLIFMLTSFVFRAQEIPPINTFTNSIYDAESQNWSISQDATKSIFIANNNGLLEFNGAKWQLYPSPNNTILRSVMVMKDKVYTGCYMEFGCWERNAFGQLEYRSISEKVKDQLIEDEQFWTIINLDDWVLFQSLNRIYSFNKVEETFKIISSETKLTKMFKVDNTIYFQKLFQGLYKIENGEARLVSDDPVVKANTIVNVLDHQDKFTIQTQERGFYILQNDGLQPWDISTSELLDGLSVYSSLKLNDNRLALGTISNGLIVLKPNGDLDFSINQSQGISNNTILSIFEDSEDNIWLGLDKGINCVNVNSPFRIFVDQKGTLGTVYTSSLFKGNLYLGTNQGLFVKPYGSNDEFSFIPGTKGQVWNLSIHFNTLFCGHNDGTFNIDGDRATKVSNTPGTWTIKPTRDYLIQGNYDGLYVLENNGGIWSEKHKIKGFDMSSKYLDFLDDTTLLVNHEYKGVYLLELNEDLTEVISVTSDGTVEKGLNSSLIKYQDDILYAYKEGVFKFDQANKQFVKDTILSKVFTQDSYITGKLILDSGKGRLWGFSNADLSYVVKGPLNNELKINTVALPHDIGKMMAGYENMLHIENDKYLLGTSTGYIIIDLDEVEDVDFEVKINSISNYELNAEKQPVDIQSASKFPNSFNNFEFELSAPVYDKFSIPEYQYQLKGIYDEWSNWSQESKILFKNLPHGDYTLNVRSRSGKTEANNVATYSFVIEKPWYLTTGAIVFYVLGFILLIFAVHNIYKGYYKKQKEKLVLQNKRDLELQELENQQELILLKNEKLKQDIENKNRELAISTMSLIKKNEFLSNIKEELKNADQDNQIKPVIKIIDKNLNNTDDWKFFQEAFNNADKDFLKKVKAKHPNLTPNDLKLCAYLRLNLSSKEIAPLLNISPRSVEVKRYRLRKKMNLPHESSLTNYILEI
ncbi:MAG: LuxR family transcriptional regulator [Psychroserpens sp.]|nr:LuxR family transcriptional regulator [Psychroserpens sp.]